MTINTQKYPQKTTISTNGILIEKQHVFMQILYIQTMKTWHYKCKYKT